MINNQIINYFLVSAKTMNFTEASKMLFVSRQALNKQILNLERELGVTLFERRSSGLSLTPPGEIYYDVFSTYMLGLEEAAKKSSKFRFKQVKNIVVGYPYALDIDNPIIAGINSYNSLNPDSVISINRNYPYALNEMTKNGDIDFLISFGNCPLRRMEGFSSCELVSYHSVIAVSDTSPKAVDGLSIQDVFRNEAVIIPHYNAYTKNGLPGVVKLADDTGIDINTDELNCSILATSDFELATSLTLLNKGISMCTSLNKICSTPHIKVIRFGKTQTLAGIWRADRPDLTVLAGCLQRSLAEICEQSKETV